MDSAAVMVFAMLMLAHMAAYFAVRSFYAGGDGIDGGGIGAQADVRPADAAGDC
jgi:hypothetical protein